MDWMSVLYYAVAVVETVALLGALVFATKGKKADKHAPEKKKFTQLSVICIVAFVVLTTLRKTYLGA